MKKLLLTIGLVIVGTLSWFFIEKPEPPFGGTLTTYELAQNCIATPQQIDKCIGELTAKERANIKGEEIAKIGSVSRTNVKFSGADYDIEITDIKAIAGGVEIFARAWDTSGQVGFGKDGSVDIERFYIINPPIMVDDPNGDVVREWTDERTGELKQRKLRESPQEAILQSLAHTVSLTDNKPRGKIIAGKTGSTHGAVYPDANPESTSVDGYAAKTGAKDRKSTVRGLAGGASSDTTTSGVAGDRK